MAGSQIEMILGVLPVPTWLMPSLLFALAMYGALEAYIALNPHHHPLARNVRRKLILFARAVYGVLSPPVKHSWQWLCTDERPRYWFGLLVFMFLSWLFFMFWFHLEFMFGKMHVLVVQGEYNQNTTLSLLGDEFRETFQKSPHNSMLVWGLHIGNGWERVVWPWWYCPFFERFIASFTTQWEYVTDWSAAAWFCGWFGFTLLKCFAMIQIGSRCFPGNVRIIVNRNLDHPLAGAGPVMRPRERSPARLPPPNPLPQGFEKACGNCSRNKGCGKPNNGTTTTLHKVNGEWPVFPVPPQCPQASPGGPIGSP